MTELGTLDRTRIRELFDLRGPTYALLGGSYHDDPYPVWHRLREQAPVHPGVLHELTGFEGPAMFVGLPEPDREHFTTFSYEACEAVYRAPETFAQWPDPVDPAVGELSPVNSMLFMNGPGHKRYRGLVQPSFVPSKAQWWIRNWVEEAVHTLIDGIVEDGHAELNVDFCAAIPVLTVVTAARVALLGGRSWGTAVAVEGFESCTDIDNNGRLNHVAAHLFSTVGMALLAGREFTTVAASDGPLFALLDEAFTRNL